MMRQIRVTSCRLVVVLVPPFWAFGQIYYSLLSDTSDHRDRMQSVLLCAVFGGVSSRAPITVKQLQSAAMVLYGAAASPNSLANMSRVSKFRGIRNELC
uniref:Putative secreted protein n=1 Tax=Anopheles darlingi TaxID=43151 RepID=A0A2M4D4H3_ANODA